MTLFAFSLAVAALLMAPGPTNTLMGLAGAQGGPGQAARLIPAELLGYLTAILPLVFVGGALVEQWPALGSVLKGAAAAWVMVLAVRLWDFRRAGGSRMVDWRTIYVTTALNPKALIFGLVLLPSPSGAVLASRLGVFCLLVSGAALAWSILGTLTHAGSSGRDRLQLIQRAASVWLALVSLTFMAAVIRA